MLEAVQRSLPRDVHGKSLVPLAPRPHITLNRRDHGLRSSGGRRAVAAGGGGDGDGGGRWRRRRAVDRGYGGPMAAVNFPLRHILWSGIRLSSRLSN